MIGVTTNVVTSVQIAEVCDKAYLSKNNLALLEEVSGVPYVPFKANSVPPSR